MKYFGKKIILGGILLAVFIFVGGILSAPKDIYGEEPIKLENDPNNPTETSLSGYVLLEPLPGLINIENTGPSGFADYLNKIFAVVIGVAGLLAVLMLVINGIQYMMTDSVFQKGEAKSGIGNALLGLFLALGAFVILNTINPDLTNLNLKVEKVEIGISPGMDFVLGGGVPSKEKIELINKATSTSISLGACDESQMATVNVFGKTVEVYKGLVPSLLRINTEWSKKAEKDRYPVKTIGGYNCRTVKTTSGTDTGKYSGHAFGLAIDINEATNPFKKTLQTDMQPEFVWFVNLFKQEEWGWGGEWGSSKDPMHFSKLPPKFNELGDGKVEI